MELHPNLDTFGATLPHVMVAEGWDAYCPDCRHVESHLADTDWIGYVGGHVFFAYRDQWSADRDIRTHAIECSAPVMQPARKTRPRYSADFSEIIG